MPNQRSRASNDRNHCSAHEVFELDLLKSDKRVRVGFASDAMPRAIGRRSVSGKPDARWSALARGCHSKMIA